MPRPKCKQKANFITNKNRRSQLIAIRKYVRRKKETRIGRLGWIIIQFWK